MIPEVLELVLITWVEHRWDEYRWNPCEDITGYELYRCLLFIQDVKEWWDGYKYQAQSERMSRKFEELPPECKRHFRIFMCSKDCSDELRPLF